MKRACMVVGLAMILVGCSDSTLLTERIVEVPAIPESLFDCPRTLPEFDFENAMETNMADAMFAIDGDFKHCRGNNQAIRELLEEARRSAN